MLVLQRLHVTGALVLVQVVRRRHGGSGRVGSVMMVPNSATQVMVMMIVVMKKFVFT